MFPTHTFTIEAYKSNRIVVGKGGGRKGEAREGGWVGDFSAALEKRINR